MSVLEHFGLTQWVNSLSSEYRSILSNCPELTGPVGDGMTCGSYALAWSLQYYSKKDNSELVKTVYEKIVEMDETGKLSVNDLHFFYSLIISAIYKFRDTWAGDIVVDLCEKSIALAPAAVKTFGGVGPTHVGYNTLIAIEKKAHNWQRVHELASAAIAQGWNGKYDAWKKEAENKLTL